MREARIDFYCDPCGERGRKQAAVHEGVIAAFRGETPLAVDLCAPCYGRFVKPLDALMGKFGIDPKTGRRREEISQPETPTVARPNLFICPIDGFERDTAGAMATHLKHKHGIAAPPLTLFCEEHDLAWKTGAGASIHFANHHGRRMELLVPQMLAQISGGGQQQLELAPASPVDAGKERAYQCPCGSAFTNYKKMANHAAQVHRTLRGTTCPDCGHESSSSQGNGRHRQIEHDYTQQQALEELKQLVREKLGVAA